MIRYSVLGLRAAFPGLQRVAALAWLLVLGLLAGCAQPVSPGIELASLGATRFVALAPQSPQPVKPAFTASAYVTSDGRRLALRQWLPHGPVEAVILALHGFNDYSFSFEGAGTSWAKDGIATYAYDQRGFGLAPERGRWPGTATLVADAVTASRILRARYPHVPLYLLGESMGGAVAAVAMSGEIGMPIPPVDGVILSAPAVWGRRVMEVVPRVALWAGVRVAPALRLTGRGLHIVASDNIPMLVALGRDPLVIKATRIDAIYGLVNLMDKALASAPRLRCRMLLMYGARDPIIPAEAMRAFVAALPAHPAEPRRLALYPEGYHMLTRDLDGATVRRDVASWVLSPLSSRGAPLPSGADRIEHERPWPPRHHHPELASGR